MSLICLIPSVLQFIFFTEVNDDSESVKIRVFFFDLLAYLQADSRASASDVNTDACGASKLVSIGIVVELVCLITLKPVPHSDLEPSVHIRS